MHILHILRILHVTYSGFLHFMDILKLFFAQWLDTCQSTIVYKRRKSEHVLYAVEQ